MITAAALLTTNPSPITLQNITFRHQLLQPLSRRRTPGENDSWLSRIRAQIMPLSSDIIAKSATT
ncbi:hypothetical protein ACJIZ3_019025 [Penstemon smallii]|uniref:Uncharacterized protein n=1 Tax=Penstemon smallii TaxID=265156 RepID=A0ABD3T1G7_9LAMI